MAGERAEPWAAWDDPDADADARGGMSTARGRRGLLVTVEGGEGAGKSTLAAALHDRAREAGLEVEACREPGGTALGERLRQALLGTGPGAPPPVPEAELLLFRGGARAARGRGAAPRARARGDRDLRSLRGLDDRLPARRTQDSTAPWWPR